MQWSSDQSRLSLASAEADFNGVTMLGLQSIEITDEISADPVYGNGSVSIGAPVGTHKAELTFSTIPEEADNVLQNTGFAFTRALGTVGITMNEPDGSGVYLINLTRVRIMKTVLKPGEAGGQKPATVEFTCAVYDPVDFNGVQSIEDGDAGAGLLGAIVGAVAGALGI